MHQNLRAGRSKRQGAGTATPVVSLLSYGIRGICGDLARPGARPGLSSSGVKGAAGCNVRSGHSRRSTATHRTDALGQQETSHGNRHSFVESS